jgi:hypothetical protein
MSEHDLLDWSLGRDLCEQDCCYPIQEDNDDDNG